MAESHQQLWAPWRMEYLRSLEPGSAVAASGSTNAAGTSPSPAPGTPGAPGASAQAAPLAHECFLCQAAKVETGSDDAKQRLVLLRDQRGIILLNRYPYTNGHLLIAPAVHLADLTDLSPVQRADLIELTALAESLLRHAINPQGVNIGINLGRCAGAGVPGHLHVHVVPRWNGDVNFMNTIGNVRVIPQALEESFAHLAQSLQSMSRQG